MSKVYLVVGVTEGGMESALGVFLSDRKAQRKATQIYLESFTYDSVFVQPMDIMDEENEEMPLGGM